MSTTLRKTTLVTLGAALLLSAAMTAPVQARGGASDNRYERELRQEMTQAREAQVPHGKPEQSGQSVRNNGIFSDVFGSGQDNDDWNFPGDNARGR